MPLPGEHDFVCSLKELFPPSLDLGGIDPMKKTKLIAFTLLCAIGLLFMGELNNLHLTSFRDEYYSADFYQNTLHPAPSTQEMVDDFQRASKKFRVDFFTIQFDWQKAYRYETRIIGTPGAIRHLKETGIKEGNNRSLFFETETIRYIPFSQYAALSDTQTVSDATTLYLIGDAADLERLRAFKAELIDKYSGGYPKDKGSDMEATLGIPAIWSLIFGIILLLSCYEAFYMRKEHMLRLVMGESIMGAFLRSILIDTCGFVLILAAEVVLLSEISFVRYRFSWVLAAFGVFLLLNIAASTIILRVNYRRDFAGAGRGSRLLIVNYGLKVVLTVIVLLIISLNINGISEAYQLYTQKGFFQQHQAYAFYKMSYGIDATDEEGYGPDDDMYRTFYETFQDQSLIYADLSGNYRMKYPFVLLNRNAFHELCREYPEIRRLQRQIEEHKVSILFPSTIRKGSTDYEYAMEMNDDAFFSESEYGAWNILSYEPGVSVQAIHESGLGYQLSRYRDPVIFVDTTTFRNKPGTTGYDQYYNYDVLYHIPEAKWLSFKKTFRLHDDLVSVTNAKKLYDFVWTHKHRQMMLLIVLMVFTCFLEASLLLLILRMEYQNNAVEMALMKVHGYSLLERNRKLFKSALYAGCMGILLSIVLNRFGKIGADPTVMLLTGAVFIALEMLGIFLNAQSLEKHRVSTILKGERI